LETVSHNGLVTEVQLTTLTTTTTTSYYYYYYYYYYHYYSSGMHMLVLRLYQMFY